MDKEPNYAVIILYGMPGQMGTIIGYAFYDKEFNLFHYGFNEITIHYELKELKNHYAKELIVNKLNTLHGIIPL